MSHESTALMERVASLRKQYHNLAQLDPPQSKLKLLSDQIQEACKAVSDSIASGANACPECKAPAGGMLKTPATVSQGRDLSAVYEVGCSGDCPLRSRASTPEKTVEAWNSGQYFKKPE